jgi:phage terminase Nu1 subunit (DNA packaging protein)
VSGYGLDRQLTQEEFAELVGVTQQAVSEMVGAGYLVRDETGRAWLLAYCKRLRDKAAGRDNDSVLTQERALLAREQREAVRLKNAVTRGEYAPISALAEVLASASQSVAERFEALPALLRTVCPDLPDAARVAIEAALADARNEWVRGTSSLIVSHLEDETDEEAGQDDVDAEASA